MKCFLLKTLAIVGVLLSPASVLAQDTPRPAKVVTVEAADAILKRTYPAIVLPSAEVELSFRVGGPLVELAIRGAMDVEKGEVMARIDPRDFESQVVQLESQRDQAVAQLKALKSGARAEEVLALEAAVASAQAQVDQALEQAARTRELAERGVVAQAKVDQDEATLLVAEANLKAQQEQLAIGLSGGRPEDIEASEAALRGLLSQLQVARDDLEDATLRAPFKGVIARRDVENFTIVQPGQSIGLLQALSVVHLSFDVPGPDVTTLSAAGVDNISNQVIFDALPGQVFDSDVVEFAVQADTATQTYRGRVAVRQPEGTAILPGMVGRVIASVPGGNTQLTVPLTSVAAEPDGTPFVWTVGDDNTARKQPITLGEALDGDVIVLSGLEAGETVVAAGVSQIVDGMRIRPVTRIGG